MSLFNIERAFRDKRAKKWNTLYWAIDLHDTVITGKYNKFNEGAEIYPGATEVFAWFARRPDMVAILYTSSYPEAIKKIRQELLTPNGIEFTYINENPECISGELCDFSQKFYFNILLDDKAGFRGKYDWYIIKETLKRIGEW